MSAGRPPIMSIRVVGGKGPLSGNGRTTALGLTGAAGVALGIAGLAGAVWAAQGAASSAKRAKSQQKAGWRRLP